MSTLRVSNIEAKADPSSPTVNEKVKITNSSGDVMLQLDGATPGITTVGINTTTAAFTVDGAQNIQFVGVVTAASLSGNLTGDVNAGVVTATSSIVVGDKFINSSGVGIGTTTTSGRNAGVGTATGTLVFNNETKGIEIYDGTRWKGVGENYIDATGGTISDYTESGTVYRAHIFTSSGTFAVNSAPPSNSSVEYLVVGGGGAGGTWGPNGRSGGGGGAGALRYLIQQPVNTSPGSYTITVGSGGVGSSGFIVGGDGSSSSIANPLITTITSPGGGGGAGGSTGVDRVGNPGGSGGGGQQSTGGTGSGDTGGTSNSTSPSNGWGNDGESGAGSGGGGGAAEIGGVPGSRNGGNGLSYSITGITTHYAGGGGGGNNSGPPYGIGGLGGGGAAQNTINAQPGATGGAQQGVQSTGVGGGGSTRIEPQSQTIGANGGSGIVVVRYQIGQLTAAAKATGGAISYYDGMTIHTFTSSDSFQVTSGPITCNWLVIGGGGAGGTGAGGGGGAGGYRTSMPEGPGGPSPTSEPTQTIANGTYSIIVGAGGVNSGRAPATAVGTSGGFSNIGFPSAIRSEGGGGGGHTGGPGGTGQNGGSGGGGNYPGLTVAVGNRQAGTTTPVPNQGYPGGTTSVPADYGTGGGGGAGGQGGAGAPSAGGNGGAGKTSTITGSPVARSGGGGGALYLPSTTVGTASAGGGYAAPNTGPAPRSGPTSIMGSENTGGGGGGSTRNDSVTAPAYPGSEGYAGNGGSGIVIIAYPS